MRFLENCAILAVVALVQGCEALITSRPARATEKIVVRADGPCKVSIDHEMPTRYRDANVETDN